MLTAHWSRSTKEGLILVTDNNPGFWHQLFINRLLSSVIFHIREFKQYRRQCDNLRKRKYDWLNWKPLRAARAARS